MDLAGLASGRGPVLRHLDRRAPAGADLEVVLSDQPDAPILDWATGRDIASALIPPEGSGNAGTESGLAEQLSEHSVDLVCLDGYGGPVSAEDIERLPPILDHHDSLLPAFPGGDPIDAALQAGVVVTGSTVTRVTGPRPGSGDDELDRIVTQEPVPVRTADPERLAERVVQEGAFRAYPRAVKQFAEVADSRDRESADDKSGTGPSASFPDWRFASDDRLTMLRYGENPHQAAALYTDPAAAEPSVIGAEQRNPEARALSYNNYNDADAALALVREFDRPAAAVIKHANPAGCAVADTVSEAYGRALDTDEMSAFGGIVALNRRCDRDTAARVADSYKEVVVAPGYSEPALDVLREREDLRILAVGQRSETGPGPRTHVEQSLTGGRLVQEPDEQRITGEDLESVTERSPSSTQIQSMVFAWPVVKHAKSNAIVLATDTETVGIGMGQVSRIDAVRLAIRKAEEHAAGKGPTGAVMASDAFFPFADAVEVAADAGIEAVVQPGGSVNDDAVIAACDEQGLAMAFTGRRAFRHG